MVCMSSSLLECPIWLSLPHDVMLVLPEEHGYHLWATWVRKCWPEAHRPWLRYGISDSFSALEMGNGTYPQGVLKVKQMSAFIPLTQVGIQYSFFVPKALWSTPLKCHSSREHFTQSEDMILSLFKHPQSWAHSNAVGVRMVSLL